VFGYVMKHKSVMPRTALRYAIEKMPSELRREAMKK
jgi:3-methyladenine DNA glycosylase AlkD